MRTAALGRVMLVLQNSARYLPQKNVDVNQLTACLRAPVMPRLHFLLLSPVFGASVDCRHVDRATQPPRQRLYWWRLDTLAACCLAVLY